MVYVGVDLHRKSSHVAVLAADGELLASRRIASHPEEFLRVFGELEEGPIEVAFEATTAGAGSPTSLSTPGSPPTWPTPLPPRPSPRQG
jgi:hypothetical protein